MKISAICLAASSLLIASCDPAVDIGWATNFDQRVDDQCLERALRSVASGVERFTYVSEGDRGFPRGTEVTQFGYPDPVLSYSYSLDVAKLPNGKTRYVHVWSKLGTNVPADEAAKILPLLTRANDAVSHQCGLSFANSKLEQNPG